MKNNDETTPDMAHLHICVDVTTSEDNLYGLFHALNERKENVLNDKTRQILNGNMAVEKLLLETHETRVFEKMMGSSDGTRALLQEIALVADKLWSNGKKLKVRFLNGDSAIQGKVKTYAKGWETHANIKFDFVTSGNADIRVTFDQGKGSWSKVGTDALRVTDQAVATMNFGWFNASTSEVELKRTTLHEFGHALGCVHEHQSPASNIKWDKPVVYNYYKDTQTPPWDEAKVDAQVFTKYTSSTVTNSKFDPASIMIYPIPKRFTEDGFSVAATNDLSATDKEFIALKYPKTSLVIG